MCPPLLTLHEIVNLEIMIWAFVRSALSPPLSLSVCVLFGARVRVVLASSGIKAALGAREQRGESEEAATRRGWAASFVGFEAVQIWLGIR